MTATHAVTTTTSDAGFAGKLRSTEAFVAGKPYLTDEAIGWLAHVHRKVGFGGTWKKGDTLHPSWDDRSFPPFGTFPRYDLTWVQWSLGLMIEATPAWREAYGRILEYMGDRYLEYWSLYEWLEHRGDDPERGNYPDHYRNMIPPGHFGNYNRVGYAANGSGPYEFDPDPVRGNGSCNLMYKGYLNLVLTMYAYATGDDKYDHPFKVVYDDEFTFEYDHRGLNELIAAQWRANRPGIACEVSKIFPWCNNLTAVGMRLYDHLHGTQLSVEYHNWKRYMREHFMEAPAEGPIEKLCAYYDPQLDYAMNEPEHQRSHNYMMNVWHGYPLDPDLFERLYEGAIRHFYREQDDGSAFFTALPGMDTDLNVATGIGAAVARELGDIERHAALKAWIEQHYEPTWDAEHGEFTFGFGLGEEWPRGQLNSWVMPALIITGPGEWTRLVNEPNTTKYFEPTIENVDYPALRPRQAVYDRDDGALYASFTFADPATVGEPTAFDVTNLFGRFHVTLDGEVVADGEVPGGRLTVKTTIGPHRLIAQRTS